MDILGIMLNFMAIILIGDYGLADDGPTIEEDSAVYEVAYSLRAQLEGEGPHFSSQWLNGLGKVSDRVSTTK